MLPTTLNPHDFIASIQNVTRKRDANTLLKLYAEITNEPPIIWGSSIIGYGSYHYRYASGHEGDSPKGGFAPREAKMVVYLMCGLDEYYQLLETLGPHSVGKSCLYLGSFDKIDVAVLKTAIRQDWDRMTKKYGQDQCR